MYSVRFFYPRFTFLAHCGCPSDRHEFPFCEHGPRGSCRHLIGGAADQHVTLEETNAHLPVRFGGHAVPSAERGLGRPSARWWEARNAWPSTVRASAQRHAPSFGWPPPMAPPRLDGDGDEQNVCSATALSCRADQRGNDDKASDIRANLVQE